ncbi:MAG: hypothetical protein RBR70_11845 [Arcobacter sp.]|jgi:hypothetical protein|uniref:hypothetical protein n=1 Tax=Arcobacter sp. TaxID=1872629 RepID=UPI002A75719E|nr:hypothetical protein [Arcobacter sp.]MDY3205755.1 hypothetical protein [Arcobacter sp.]
MHSKQIAVEYLAPKISDPTMIFKDINIFKSILPWAKDSAREFFETQKSKMFLTQYVDDIAPIVDEYLISRVNKMYKKAIKSQNKLFTNLCSSEKTVAWIIDRWINVFVNLSWNSRYKNHVDLSKIKFDFNHEMDFTHNSLEDILEFEKLQKFPKNEIIEALKFIWEDGYFDHTLDSEDIDYLCKKFDLTIKDVFGTDDLVKLNLKKEQTESGHSQLVLFFT